MNNLDLPSLGNLFPGVVLQRTTKRLRANFQGPFKTSIHSVLEAVNAEIVLLGNNPSRLPTHWDPHITHASLKIEGDDRDIVSRSGMRKCHCVRPHF